MVLRAFGLTATPLSLPKGAPDGQRIAVSIANRVWIYNLARENSTRLTYESGSAQLPLWTPELLSN